MPGRKPKSTSESPDDLAPPAVVEVLGDARGTRVPLEMVRVVYERWNPDGLVECAPSLDDFARNGVPRALLNLLYPGWWTVSAHIVVAATLRENAEHEGQLACDLMDGNKIGARTGWTVIGVARREDGDWDVVLSAMPEDHIAPRTFNT